MKLQFRLTKGHSLVRSLIQGGFAVLQNGYHRLTVVRIIKRFLKSVMKTKFCEELEHLHDDYGDGEQCRFKKENVDLDFGIIPTDVRNPSGH